MFYQAMMEEEFNCQFACPVGEVNLVCLHEYCTMVSRSATFQSLPDLLPMAPDQTRRPQKHSGGTMHNAG